MNLALLGFLKEINSEHYDFWNSFHSNKEAYYDRALKYAYRPFNPRLDLNKFGDEIDPRTYFVLKNFIEKKKEKGEDLILPSTWLLTFDEIIEGKLTMPFRTNNVDASVCANFLFGICYQILAEEISLESKPELLQMTLNTVELLEFTVEEILQKRPTLMLVYYPSKYDFYWFIARIVHLLKRNSDHLPEPLGEIKERLEKLMKGLGTEQILKSAKIEPGVDLDRVYWVEFLGNYGKKNRN